MTVRCWCCRCTVRAVVTAESHQPVQQHPHYVIIVVFVTHRQHTPPPPPPTAAAAASATATTSIARQRPETSHLRRQCQQHVHVPVTSTPAHVTTVAPSAAAAAGGVTAERRAAATAAAAGARRTAALLLQSRHVSGVHFRCRRRRRRRGGAPQRSHVRAVSDERLCSGRRDRVHPGRTFDRAARSRRQTNTQARCVTNMHV